MKVGDLVQINIPEQWRYMSPESHGKFGEVSGFTSRNGSDTERWVYVLIEGEEGTFAEDHLEIQEVKDVS